MNPIQFGRRNYMSRRTCRDNSINLWRVIWMATPNGRRVLLSHEHYTSESAKSEGGDYVKLHGGSFTLRQI